MYKASWPRPLICGLVLALAQPGRTEPPLKEEKNTNRPFAKDLYGDPLPAGAIARIGTTRGRHAQAISFITFLPDGQSALTACQDQMIRVWDVKTGKEIRRFGKPSNPWQQAGFPGMPRGFLRTVQTSMPFHAALSADGKLLACGSKDGPMRLWEVATGKVIHQINGPGLKMPGGGFVGIPGMMGVSNLALSPDGKTVAGAAMDGTIHLWDASNAKEIRQIAQRENQNMPVSIGSSWGPLLFSPDGKTILDSFVDIGNGNLTGKLRLWDVATGKKRFETENEAMGMMYKAAFSPDGKILACGNMEGTVRLVNADSGKELRRFKEPQLWGPLIFSPDSKKLVTQNLTDHAVQIWDVQSGQELRTLIKGTSSGLLSFGRNSQSEGALSFSPDGKLLAVVQNHALRVLDVSTGKDTYSVDGNQTAVARVHFLPDCQSLVIRSEDGKSQVWDIAARKERSQLHLAIEPGSMAVDVSRDGRRIAVGMPQNQIQIWDATNGKKLQSIDGQKTGFSAFAFSPDAKVLAVREMMSPLVRLHEVENGKEIRRLGEPPKGPAANQVMLPFLMNRSLGLIFSPDGQRIAAAIDENSLGVWNVANGRQVALFQESIPLALSFSPDNRTIALATEEDGCVLWEIATSQVRRYLGKKPKDANPIGNFMMPPGIGMGAAAPVMSFYSEAATNLTFSPDGKLACQARSDQKIAVWETATGRELGQLDGRQGDITSLAFSGTGKQLASGGSDTTTFIWDLTDLLASTPIASKGLSDRQIEDHWAVLAGGDAAKAYESVCLLSTALNSPIAFLRKHLKPAQAAATGRIDKLIKDLDDKEFSVREKASNELQGLGELAVPAARKALQSKPSAETRRRLERLLSAVDGKGNISDDRLRTIRAIEVLERIGTGEARQLLQGLASGAPGALQTEEAKESLQRLSHDKISSKKPK